MDIDLALTPVLKQSHWGETSREAQSYDTTLTYKQRETNSFTKGNH